MRFLLLVLPFIACGGDKSEEDDTGTSESGVARIELLPSAMLLTQIGDSQAITVIAYDANEQVMEGLSFSLTTEDPDVSVSGSTVTALSDVGSAQVRVEVEGVSQSLFVLMAEPVEGAILIPDHAVKGMEIVDEGPWQPGSRYKVTLAGVDVSVGDILIASESAPIMGKVTAVDRAEITLILVSPETAFEQLEVHEEWVGADLQPEPKKGTESAYNVERPGPGRLELTPREKRPMSLWDDLVECEGSGNVASLNLGGVSFTVNTTGMNIVFDYSRFSGFQKLLVTGAIEIKAEAKLEIAAQFEGKFTCEADLVEVPIPLNGPLSAIFGLNVTLGAGGGASGKMVIADASISLKASQTAQAILGIDCSGNSCEWLHEFNIPSPEFGLSIDKMDIAEDFRIEAEIQLYGILKPVIGPRFPAWLKIPEEYINAASIELLKVDGGLSEKWVISPVLVQAMNAGYASSEALSLFIKTGLPFFNERCDPEDLLCTILGVQVPSLSIQFTEELAGNPKGSWTQTPFEMESTTVVENVPNTLTIRLSPESVEWGISVANLTYNVDEVIIYAYDADELTMTERARIPASEGQEVFEWEWTPTAADANEPPIFTAFVNPFWPLLGEMEIVKDSRISTGCVPSYHGRIVLRNNEGITVIGPGGSVNDSEDVSFIGDYGNGETVVILSADGGLTTPAFAGNGRTYGGGAPINSSGQTTVRERVSNKYLTRIWNLDETSTTTGRSWDDDFDSAQFWQDINSSGQVALVGLTDDSENVSLFKWTGTQLQTLGVYDGYTSVRPQISDSGRVVYRDDNDQLLVNDGNGSTAIHSGPVSRHPGISDTGDRLAWITTGSIESLYFAYEKDGDYKTLTLSTTPNGFSNLDEENRQGVAHIPGVCDAGASVVVFLATKNGIEGVHVAALNDSAQTGEPALAGIQTLVESGDVIDGETLGDFSLFDPISPNGTIVLKSGTDTFVLFSPEWPR